MGIEPTLFAWEAKVLPLNYTRAAFDYRCGWPPKLHSLFQKKPSGLAKNFFSLSRIDYLQMPNLLFCYKTNSNI